MEDQLISFETAKLAKEKGFTTIETPFGHYGYDKLGHLAFKEIYVLAPTQSLLQKWLRDIHNVYIEVRCVVNRTYTFHIVSHRYYSNKNYTSWEQALEVGLQEALKLIEL